MLPEKYAVENAATAIEVLGKLSSLLEYLRSCHVDTVLPWQFSGLSAASIDAVRSWAHKLQEPGRYDYRLGAAGQCWLEQLREAFMAASRRLDELDSGPGYITAVPDREPRVAKSSRPMEI